MSSCGHPTLEDVPENVMLNILSILPIKTIIYCKCVCKTWRNLVMDPYFANLHLSRSHEGLMIHRSSYRSPFTAYKPGFLNIVEIEDDINHQRLLNDPVLNLDLDACMVGSVNGLICLRESRALNGTTYIYNPINGHVIFLPKPQNYSEVKWGFGVSMAGEYKVIRIFQRSEIPNPVEIEVYTIGTDHQWRNIGQSPEFVRRGERVTNGLYLNGYVHWMDGDIIYAFDLDKETFESFGSPPQQETNGYSIFGILKGCISLFACSYYGLTVWVMKEHKNEKSWHKKLEIGENSITCRNPKCWYPVCLIDGLNDTSILILVDEKKHKLVGYCMETNRVEETKIHGDIFHVMNYRPSFLKL